MNALSEPLSTSIYDTQGRKIAHFSLQVGEKEVQTVSDGLYFVSANSSSNHYLYKVLVSN